MSNQSTYIVLCMGHDISIPTSDLPEEVLHSNAIFVIFIPKKIKSMNGFINVYTLEEKKS